MMSIIFGSIFCLLNTIALMWTAGKGFYPLCFVSLSGIIISGLIIIRGFERLSEDNDDS